MDWIKIKPNHILHEYSDLRDSEFRAWIKIMALAAELEHEPTRDQMLKHVHYKTLDSLQEKLNKRSIDIQYVLNKVLIDVQYTLNQKRYWRDHKKKKRVLSDDVHKEIKENSHNRLDKIRIDKNIYNNTIPEWIDKNIWDSFLEMRKIMRSKPTQKAIELLLLKLKHFREDGQDPNKILEQSIENNWKGVFPLNGSGNLRGTATSFEKTGREGRNVGYGGPRISKEYNPEPVPIISEEERARNLSRIQELIGKT